MVDCPVCMAFLIEQADEGQRLKIGLWIRGTREHGKWECPKCGKVYPTVRWIEGEDHGVTT